jgi:hypothetical protein
MTFAKKEKELLPLKLLTRVFCYNRWAALTKQKENEVNKSTKKGITAFDK